MKKISQKTKKVFASVFKSILCILLAAVIVCSCILIFGLPINPSKQGWCIDNNGYDINSPEVERLISVTPSEVQMAIGDMEYYSFIHYGMNTFTGREWGDGNEDPAQFCPETVDTDQWVRVLKESGSKGIILTAKHHDGFCLWPSAYTEHDIENSPYQNGKGDICKQMAESCKKYDMKLGFYLSPWDMHEETYATDAYNDYFTNQLTELCTNYGEIFSFWFDGARGEDVGDWQYDFDRYYAVIRELQPNAAIALTGPDVRWIGNEAGIVRKSEWSVIPSGSASIEAVMEQSQHSEEDAKRLQKLKDKNSVDNGSRELVEFYPDLIWKQGEADVSIHHGWFYTDEGNAAKMRSAAELEKIYYRTVGGNALLLMNVPPTKDGVIADKDVELLQDFKARIDKKFAEKLSPVVEAVGEDSAVPIDFSADGSYKLSDNENVIRLTFDEKQKVSTIVLSEDVTQSQRVEEFRIYAKTAAGYLKIYDGTVIGSKKICLISPLLAKSAKEFDIVITQSRNNPVIENVEAYA